MQMEQIILTPTTKQELITEITAAILSGMTSMLKESRDEDLNAKTWLTSKETESILKISSVTRWNWSNDGILKSYKIGNRLRYRKDEVMQALIRLESKKTR
jgi:hypothetical protein